MSQMYEKKCKGCKKPFTSAARNTKYSPDCKCAERKAKMRAKRAKERRAYAKNPEPFLIKSRSRAAARKLVLTHFGVVRKSGVDTPGPAFNPAMGCNAPGCTTNFENELAKELAARDAKGTGPRGARHAALQKLLRKLECHHRDHDYMNNHMESYPTRSNLELLCRKHHEHADRAKAGKAELVPWRPLPDTGIIEHLLDTRKNNPKRFFTVSVYTQYKEWWSC